MNSMVSNNQNAVAHINSAKVVEVFKAIAPRSFEKTFEGIATKQIIHAMKICIDGLTHEQVYKGLSMVRDNGYCPDPAMFRKWCLGIEGFGSEQQRAIDSYKGKNAALANILRWRADQSAPITNAEKEAYDRCYEMFNAIEWAYNSDKAAYLAYDAFKENYVEVVKELVAKGEQQGIWTAPKAISSKVKRMVSYAQDYLNSKDGVHAYFASAAGIAKEQFFSITRAEVKEHQDRNNIFAYDKALYELISQKLNSLVWEEEERGAA
ncbi:hypothetical protein RFZ45_21750 [Acinetobacter baumannii]|nr:hypothetical protein [Acinetobacter baumannii]